MSRRKHVTLNALQQEVVAPAENESIVRAVGSRGSNIMELWIKNGNYLIVEDTEGVDAAVSGQITQVLYADHVKQLQKMPGIWPKEFEMEASSTSAPATQPAAHPRRESDSGSESSDDGLPPLERINNRRVVEYAVSDSGSESD